MVTVGMAKVANIPPKGEQVSSVHRLKDLDQIKIMILFLYSGLIINT